MAQVSSTPIASEAHAIAPIQLDAEGRIGIDIPCRKCSYNLRGLLPEARCPECNSAIGYSLQGDYLRFADPGWVEKLASGINWWIGGAIVAAVFGVISSMAVSMRVMPILALLLQVIAPIPMLIGYWRLTTPDPSGVGESEGVNARKLSRVALIAGAAFGPVQQLLQHCTPLFFLISSIGMIMGLVGTFAIFVYVRRLALRIPDNKLARHCRILMWGWACVLFFGAFTTVFLFTTISGRMSRTATSQLSGSLGYMPSSSSPTSQTSGRAAPRSHVVKLATTPTTGQASGFELAMTAHCFTMACGLILGIWTLVLVWRFRRALSTWARPASLHSELPS